MKKKRKENFLLVLCFTLGFIISIIAAFYGTFSDEADILSASWLMAKGYHLYSDIFCHHMPMPYWFLEIFQNLHITDVVFLRILFAIITQSYFLFLFFFFKKRIGKFILPMVSVFYALMRNICFQNYILADSFVALGFFTIFLEIMANPNMKFSKKDQFLISFATIISFGSSLIAIYPLAIFYLYYIVHRLFLYKREKEKVKKNFKEDIIFLFIVLIPFLIIALYFLLTNTMDDFIENGVQFNTNYYSLFNGEQTPVSLIIEQFTKLPKWGVNRLKCGTIGIPLFLKNSKEIFAGVNFVIFLTWSIVAVTKKRKKAILLILFSYFCYMRDDFHASTFYLLCTYFVAEGVLFCFKRLQEIEKKERKLLEWENILSIGIITYIIIYLTILGINNIQMLEEKEKVTSYGEDYKEIILTVTKKEDKILAVPLYPELYFVTQREPVSKNIFYLPWQSIKPGMKKELMEEIKIEKPTIIIYNEKIAIWGMKTIFYTKELKQYLKEEYFTIEGLENVFFRKEEKEEIIQKLLEKRRVRRTENGKIIFCDASL